MRKLFKVVEFKLVPYKYERAILDWRLYYRPDKQRKYLFIEIARRRLCFNWPSN